jgi:hypothetical protein
MRRALVLLALALSGCLALAQHDGFWPCAQDSDCDVGDTCRVIEARSVCVPTDYCVTNDDCAHVTVAPVTSDCVANRCAPRPCTVDSQCAPFRCGSAFACLISCASDAQCEAGSHCASGLCAPPSCSSDAECGGYRCANGSCGTSCSGDADCTFGDFCYGRSCSPPKCTFGRPSQCGGYACSSAGTCETSCAGSTGCDPGLLCVGGGHCQCDPTPGQCGGFRCRGAACLTLCYSDADCDPGLLCSPQGQCVACTGTPAPCASASNCTSVKGCSLGASACTGGDFDCGVYSGDATACGNHVTCIWDIAAQTCSGTAPCSGVPSTSCASIPGCTALGPCGGTPTPCAMLPYAACQVTAGCSLK